MLIYQCFILCKIIRKIEHGHETPEALAKYVAKRVHVVHGLLYCRLGPVLGPAPK